MKHLNLFSNFKKSLLAAALAATASSSFAGSDVPVSDIVKIIGGIIGAVAQNSTNQPAQGKAAPQQVAAINGNIDARTALQALYGGVATANAPDRDCKEYATWNPPLNTEKFKEYFQMGEQYKNQPLLVCSKFSATYTEQDKQKFVLVTRAGIREAFDVVNFGTTDVPAPILGMAVFVKEGGQWKLEAEDKFVSYTGFSDTQKLQKTGPNKYGVLSTSVTHVGAGCDIVDVSVLMSYAGSVKAFALAAPLSEEEQMYECSATSASFDTKAQGDYYPVTVKHVFIDDRGRRHSKSARLQFQNGSYTASVLKGKKRK